MTAAGLARTRFLVLCIGAVLLHGPAFAQSPDDRAVELPLVLSTTPMTRSADLMLSASILSTSGIDVALANIAPSLFTGTTPGARVSRIAKLALFDVPVVSYFTGLNHEWGHQSSASEFDVRSQLSFIGTPWSGKPFSLVGLDAIPVEPPALAVVHGGGLEASRRLKDRAETRMLSAERVAPGHALAAIVASLDAPIYAFYDLSPERFSVNYLGDVLSLVRDIADRQGGTYDPAVVERVRHRVRVRTVLNLLDTALWSETYGVIADHVWKGDASARIRWIRAGNAQILPSLRYELSPFGSEYYAGTLFRAAGATGKAYGRWTERLAGDRQAGAGLWLSRWSVHGVTPRIELDMWSHTTDGFGLHVGGEAEVPNWPSRRAMLTIGGGAKSEGHLVGYALDGGAYVTAGMVVKVW